MEFINVEEFLKQPKEVQEVFRDWCENNLEVNDYVVPINPETNEVVGSICRINQCLDTRQHKVNVGRVFYLETCLLYDTVFEFVPLFTEGQLRKFIEDRTDCVISELSLNTKGYTLIIGYKAEYIDGEPRTKRIFRNLGDNLLQAYWKVALKVAKESVENEYK